MQFKMRADYTNYRTYKKAFEKRIEGSDVKWGPGYIPPEITYGEPGREKNMHVRYLDMSFLTAEQEEAEKYLDAILSARKGDEKAISFLKNKLDEIKQVPAFDLKSEFTENKYVVPCVSDKYMSEELISHKGTMLLKLIRKDYPVPDFCILNSRFSQLEREERIREVRIALGNLERLTGSRLGDPGQPLIFALRCAMPRYIPGLMPTYLNVGVTEDVFTALGERMGDKAASKIYLNNLKTLYVLLYRDSGNYDKELVKRAVLSDSTDEVKGLILILKKAIKMRDERLLADALYQTLFFVESAIEGFRRNSDLLYTFVKKECYPSLILQKMVWTIIDDNSYPGVLYSRHSRTGLGRQIEFFRNIFGEEIMTGTIETKETEYFRKEEIREDFPAVYHFDPLLHRMEKILETPVTVEFAAESGRQWDLFAVLQVNRSELTGRATLLSAVDMYEKGMIDRKRVISLIQPYHLRQIISDTIDNDSFKDLKFFCVGVSVLPRTAVSARIYFSAKNALEAKKRGESVCICKENFLPADTIVMNEMDGIISINPAAIHVVTACRSFGIPAFLNLEHYGVRMKDNMLINKEGVEIREGDWVSLSSRRKTIFTGKAKFKKARFQKYLDGEKLEMEPKEEKVFINMSTAFEAYRKIVENADLNAIVNLKDLVKLLRNDLRKDPEKASEFLNRWFDSHTEQYLEQILQSELGTHQEQYSLYNMLTMERKTVFFKGILEICFREGLSGYNAGAFMLGRFLCQQHPIRFWSTFSPREIVFMFNEYMLFEKYIALLNQVGERKINRARKHILNQGLCELNVNKSYAELFLPVKLFFRDPSEFLKTVDQKYETETGELLSLLSKPYGELYDYHDSRALNRLAKICEDEGLILPGRDES